MPCRTSKNSAFILPAKPIVIWHKLFGTCELVDTLVRGSFGTYRTFAHTTRAVASLYQMSHLVCSVECRQLPDAVGAANVFTL